MTTWMTTVINVALAILYTFVLFGAGAFAVFGKFISRDSIEGWSDFCISVLQPCLIFHVIRSNCTRAELTSIWQLPVLGLAIVVINALLAFPVVRFCLPHATGERRATMLHLLTTNNFLYLPLVIVDSMWGSRAVYLLLFTHIGSVIGLWTAGIAVMSASDVRQLIRKLLSPNFLAAILAVVFVLLDLRLPKLAMKLAGDLGDTSVVLGLLLIGASIYSSIEGLADRIGECLIVVVARLVALPMVTMLLISLLPLDIEYRRIAMVVAAMPASCLSVLIVRKYGGNHALAGQVVLVSTLASLVTIPLVLIPFL